MTKTTFEKVSKTNKVLYGPRTLLLCGFTAEAQPKFSTVLEIAGIRHVAMVWANESDGLTPLKELFASPADTGKGIASTLPRAIIMAGIAEKELHALMAVCKKARMQPALWATLTPTSETWLLSTLLEELTRERDQMQRSRKT
jgi:hypothetical protein